MLTRLATLGIRAPRRVLGLAGLLLGGRGGARRPGGVPPVQRRLHRSALAVAAGDHPAGAAVRRGRHQPGADRPRPGRCRPPAARRAGTNLVTELRRSPHVSEVQSYWTAPPAQAAGLRSHNGAVGLVVGRVAGTDDTAPARAGDIVAPLVGRHEGATIAAGGQAVTYHQVNETTKADLAVSEAVAIPLTTVVADPGLRQPLGGAAARGRRHHRDHRHHGGAARACRRHRRLDLRAQHDHGTGPGAGHRLQPVRGQPLPRRGARRRRPGRRRPHDDATAGRTVLFSALTVGLSLAAMLVFPLYFLRSFAYAGIAVVGLATVGGTRAAAGPADAARPAGRRARPARGWLRRLLGRPEPAEPAVEGLLVPVGHGGDAPRRCRSGWWSPPCSSRSGLPFLRVQFGYADERVLPPSAPAHQVGRDTAGRVRQQRRRRARGRRAERRSTAPNAIGTYAGRLSAIGNVTSVGSAAGTYVDGRQVARLRSGDARRRGLAARPHRARPADRRGDAAQEAAESDTSPCGALGGQTAEQATASRRSAGACRTPSADRTGNVHRAVPVHGKRRAAAQGAACSIRFRCRPPSARWCGSSRTAIAGRCSAT